MLSKLPFYGGTGHSWRRQISKFHIRWTGLANPTEQRSFCPSVGIGAKVRDGSSTASSIMTAACSVRPRKGWPAFRVTRTAIDNWIAKFIDRERIGEAVARLLVATRQQR